MLINYPRLQHQKDRTTAHAGNVLGVVSLIFAAGVVTGILSGTKIGDAMAQERVRDYPRRAGAVPCADYRVVEHTVYIFHLERCFLFR